MPHTCSRGAGTGGASVGVQGEGSAFTRYRERGRERRTRYRGVSLAGAMGRRRDGERRRGRSRGQPCEARCRRVGGGTCTGAGSSGATTADGRADAGARRSRHRRRERCNGGEPMRCPWRARREAPARAPTNTRRAARDTGAALPAPPHRVVTGRMNGRHAAGATRPVMAPRLRPRRGGRGCRASWPCR